MALKLRMTTLTGWREGLLKHTVQDIETREEAVTKGSRCDQKMSYAEEPFCSTE